MLYLYTNNEYQVIDDSYKIIDADEVSPKELFKSLKENDRLVVKELSIFGNSTKEIRDIVKKLLDKHIHIEDLKDDLVIDYYTLKVFDVAIELRGEIISKTAKKSLQKAKESGKKLGHPFGYKWSKLEKHRAKILTMLEKGATKAEVARKFNVTWKTAHDFVKTMSE